MKNLTVWGLVAGVVAGGVLTLPVEAAAAKAAVKVAAKASAAVSSTQVSATTVAVPDVGAEKSARVTLLDKQTNRKQVLVLTSGDQQTVGSVVVKLTKCMPDYAGVLGQDIAWLDVTEGADGSGRSTPWFSGWMFNTYPEISTLDHPRYDLQLQGCGVKARQVNKASGSAPVLDSGPVGDTETPNDTPVTQEDPDTSKDPYYVPGVGNKSDAVPAATPDAPAAPVTEAPAAAPTVDTEAPAAVEPQAGAGTENQQDLHKMMDGTY